MSSIHRGFIWAQRDGRAQPTLFHRAMRGCLVAAAGFKMKKQCMLLRVEMGTACSLLYKHQDSHSLGKEITAPKHKVCLLHQQFPSFLFMPNVAKIKPDPSCIFYKYQTTKLV